MLDEEGGDQRAQSSALSHNSRVLQRTCRGYEAPFRYCYIEWQHIHSFRLVLLSEGKKSGRKSPKTKEKRFFTSVFFSDINS